MTTQEIVKALRYCTGLGFGYSLCGVCPLGDKRRRICRDLYGHAADMLESFTAELETTHHQLEQAKQELDAWKLRAEAAEYDMRKAIMGTGSPCKSCKYSIQDDAPCSVCDCVSHWQWRGPCAENGGQEAKT